MLALLARREVVDFEIVILFSIGGGKLDFIYFEIEDFELFGKGKIVFKYFFKGKDFLIFDNFVF